METENRTKAHGRPTGDPLRFGMWLSEVLHRRRMSSAALAKTANVSPGMVSRWINGISVPSPQSVTAIASALDVPIGEALMQAGHVDNATRAAGAPERDHLHHLVDRLPLELVGPYTAVFEAIINSEEGTDDGSR